MGNAIRFFVWLLTCVIAPLRYRVQVHGRQQLHGLKGPVLLLPNHPAFIDPALIFATFYGILRPRTVLYEGNFPGPIRAILVKLLRAVPVPDLQRPSHEAHQQTVKAVAEVIAGLRRGENFILWPSGRIQREGVEQLGAARALTEILREVPEANVILVRTSGVWGSMFSFARTGQMPQLGRSLLSGMLLLASNLIFFSPRRRVDITVEIVDRRDLPDLNWENVNRWFEAHYNPEGPERPTYVPYHCLFGPWSYQFPALNQSVNVETEAEHIHSEAVPGVTDILAAQLGRSLKPGELNPGTRLEDLGLDSLQRMDVTLAIEHRFTVSAGTVPDTIGQLLALAQGIARKEFPQPPPAWYRPPSNVESLRILGETIPAAFVARALSNPRDVAAADEFSGVYTYERLLIGAMLMAGRFSRLPATRVGLMLPASVASDMMLMGLYLANKLPVVLNWTTGPANLQHAVQLTGVTHVVSSRQLRARLGIGIQGVQFLDVEELQHQVGWLEKLRWFVTARCLPGVIRRRVPVLEPGANAVILFTSGSEKSPKAVPLTHRNIVSNLEMVPAILDLTNADAVLGFLPMFHSFGFTMTGVFPLLANIRVVHHSDPTDVAGLTGKIAAYAPTVLVGMPSLVGRLLERARSGDVASLRLIVVGAEACPSNLYDAVRRVAPRAHLLEGYGITECSPAIAANRPKASRPGSVGLPLPGVEVCVVDLETDETVSPGKMGMLLVNGPGVFEGYLGDEASPFVVRAGTRWFVTGDLVEIDSDGFIHFRGRLKRFLKVGGEMISLPALEEPFTLRYPPATTGPRVAVEGIETKSGRDIVLFTTEPIRLEDANAWLTESGFRGVMRLDEVRRLDQIPLVGTGKIDYRRLRSIIQEKVAQVS
ncbi:MAG: AMP-binding protein [Planctomycetes bacterium]|nr:AMP-binding protein [Planctomycetota bacterium]